MSDKTTTGTSRMPGNDGTWFLKAAGVDTAATELGDVTRNAGSTSELVQELWDADLGQDALSGFRPEALSKQVQRKRNFRWPMVVAALLVLVAVAGFVLWLPGTSDARGGGCRRRVRTVLCRRLRRSRSGSAGVGRLHRTGGPGSR